MKKILKSLKGFFLPYSNIQSLGVFSLCLVAIISLFFEDYTEASFYTLLIVMLSFGAFLLLLVRQPFRRVRRLEKGLLILIGVFLLTILFSSVWYWSILHLLQITGFLILFYLTVSFVKTKKQRLCLFYFLISISVVSTVIGFADFLSSDKPMYLKRFYGTVHMHVFAGGYLVLIIPLALVLFVYAKSRWDSLLWGVLSALFLLALLLTFARGAWISFILQFLVLAVFARRKLWSKKWSLVSIVFLVLGVSFIISSPKSIFGRLSSIVLIGSPARSAKVQSEIYYDMGAVHRFDNYRNTLRIFGDNPLFGIGLENYGFAYHQYQDKPWIYSSASHSSYFDFLAETGVCGVLSIIFLGFICFGLLKDYLLSVYNDPSKNVCGLALFIGIFGALSHMGIDSDLGIPTILLIFLLEVALLISFALEPKKLLVVTESFTIRQKALISLFLIAAGLLSFSFAKAVFYFQKAQNELRSKSSSQALLLYEKSLSFNPILTFTYENMGAMYLRENKPQKAVYYFKQAVKLNPMYPEHTLNLALAYAALEENEKAEEYFKKTLELGPYTTPRYYNAFAKFYIALAKKDEAVKIYEEAVAHFPHTEVFASYSRMFSLMKKHIFESYLSLASNYLENNTPLKAKSLLVEALKFEPQNPVIKNALEELE